MSNPQDVEFTEIEKSQSMGQKLIPKVDEALLKGVSVELDCCIGTSNVALSELATFKFGDVLKLDQEVNEDIELRLNGIVVAQGKLVAIDGNFGVEITQVADISND